MGDKEISPKASFWKTLPGVLTAITGFVGAIAALIPVLKPLLKPDNHVPRAGLYEIKAKILEVLPYGLINTMKLQDVLRWFDVEVENRGPEPFPLKIYTKVLDSNSVGIVNEQEQLLADFTIPPKTTQPKSVPLVLTFLNSKFEDEVPLTMSWRIVDDRQVNLMGDTVTIRVLPKNILYWDLTTLQGAPVPQEFLLASLTAWILTTEPVVKARARQFLQSIDSEADPPSFARQWFEKCYTQIFRDSRDMHINPTLYSFKPQGKQKIRIPSQILEEGSADPLEAALLLGALSKAVAATSFPENWRLVLFMLSEKQEKLDHKTSFFSWSTGPDEWHALDTTNTTVSFEENERYASSRIAKLLKEKPDILQALDTRGVFIKKDWSILALDFATAAKHFRIRGLP